MAKDYKQVELRDCKLKGIELIKEADKRCYKAISSVRIWTQEAVPHILNITDKQFETFNAMSPDPRSKPTGKEIFKTSNGFLFEIKVHREREYES